MRTEVYFYTYEDAINFAKENGISEWRVRNIAPNQNLAAFNIEGYSKVVQFFKFERYFDDYTKKMSNWYFESCGCGIKILATGEIFRPFEVKHNKFALHLFKHEILNHAQDFRYEEPEPNLIGVPTIKKIDAWISYIHMKETARIDYNNYAILRNKTFADKFKAKYPNANYRTMADGWVSSFVIEYGAFYFKYTSGADGRFYREVSLIHKNVPTDEELLK